MKYARAIATPVLPLMGGGFSPASLFAAGEAGVWYDPTDFSTMFQDSAGTTPVTAVEQPVGLLLDKSKGLALGAELVSPLNLTTGWTSSGSAVTFDSASTYTAAGIANVFSDFFAVGRWYKLTINVTFTSSTCTLYNAFNATNIIGSALTSGVTATFYFNALDTELNIRPGSAGVVTVNSITVREIAGNHASQSTAASRPVLSARVNQLTFSEQFDNAAWAKFASSVTANSIVAPSGTTVADTLTADGTSAIHRIEQTATAGSARTLSIYAKAGTNNFIQLFFGGDVAPWANFDLSAGTVGSSGTNQTASIEAVGNGWYRCVVYTASTTASNVAVGIISAANAARGETNTLTTTVYLWGADLRVTNDGVGLPTYQRVAAATDYDTNGFPLYLRFDGVDDSLATGTIDPGAVDKAQVFAGVRKLSDAVTSSIAESSVTAATNNGSFRLSSTTSAIYSFTSRGTTGVAAASAAYSSPVTSVLTGLGDVSGDAVTIRVNRVHENQGTTDQGTGNYLAYPLYIGARAGTSAFFNGQLYSLIVRFSAQNMPTDAIKQVEGWVNSKTKAYETYYAIDPATLFSSGEQGAWYDPTDFLPNWRLNLLTYTEQFDNAAWVKSSVTVTAGAVEAPDGTIAAEKMVDSVTSGYHYIHQLVNFAAGSWTVSAYFKAAELSLATIQFYSGPVNSLTNFNLSTRVATISTITGLTGMSAAMVDVGGGWYRCSVTFTLASATSGMQVRFMPNNGALYSGDGTSGLYIWGADVRLTSNVSVSPTYQKITDGVQDYFSAQPQPVMFQDSAGTIPVSAVEQPVGLILDKSKSLASTANINFPSFASTSGWTVSNMTVALVGDAIVATNVGAFYGHAGRPITTFANTWYKVTCTVNRGTSSIIYAYARNTNFAGAALGGLNVTAAGDQTVTYYFMATSSASYIDFGTEVIDGAYITIESIVVSAIAGNHASQATAASRPVLSARVNLLTYSEQFDNAVWTEEFVNAIVSGSTVAPNGTATADTITAAAGSAGHNIYSNAGVAVAGDVVTTYALYVKKNTHRFVSLVLNGGAGGYISAVFDLDGGGSVATQTNASGASSSISSTSQTADVNGWFRLSIVGRLTSGTARYPGFALAGAATGNTLSSGGNPEFTAAGTESVFIWGADCRATNDGVGLPAYQRVAAATDYDTSGFPLYLRFDGVDDSLATGSIDFSATDKATYWVGARKLSGSGPQYLMELGTGIAENAFNIVAPPSLDAAAYDFRVATHQRQTLGSYASPVSNVLSVQQNLAGASAAAQTVARINGLQLSLTGTNVGTGNFINAPIHIGRRAGASGPFNGRLHQLIVRGAQSSTAQIASTELFINAKTEAY